MQEYGNLWVAELLWSDITSSNFELNLKLCSASFFTFNMIKSYNSSDYNYLQLSNYLIIRVKKTNNVFFTIYSTLQLTNYKLTEEELLTLNLFRIK